MTELIGSAGSREPIAAPAAASRAALLAAAAEDRVEEGRERDFLGGGAVKGEPGKSKVGRWRRHRERNVRRSGVRPGPLASSQRSVSRPCPLPLPCPRDGSLFKRVRRSGTTWALGLWRGCL